MRVEDAYEMTFKNGQREIIFKVKQYLLDSIKEWEELGDRKYELPNMQVYNHIRKCLDDLEKLEYESF